MGQLISQLMTTELKVAVILCIVCVVVLYVLSIIWVVRDAYLRDTKWQFWGIIALIPVVGIIAYCLLRPPLMQIDRDEQELEIAIKQRELQRYGECGACGCPVEVDYILCPNCHTRLKNLCPQCHHALDPAWTLCPYCAAEVQEGGISIRPANPRKAPRPRPNGQGSASSRSGERSSERSGSSRSSRPRSQSPERRSSSGRPRQTRPQSTEAPVSE